MILEISEMINLIEDHFKSEWCSDQVLTVGGIIGTSIFKHGLHACLRYIPFEKILVLDGCQDYIGLLRKPVFNYRYYLDLFRSIEIPTIDQIHHPLYRSMVQPLPDYQMTMDESMVINYDALIVNNAHLIPTMYLDALCKTFRGKVLLVVDPLDCMGEKYYNHIPTLYDSLTKQSKITALAREMYDVPTRSIDRKVKCDFRQMKMQKRSIGKIDANQYVTNSPSILASIQEKQLQSQPRKNQKFVVAHKHVQFMQNQDHVLCAIGPHTMLSITTVSKPLMKLRIHSSTSNVYTNITYMDNHNALYVKPANIISLEDALYHRFQSVVMVLGEEPMTNRMWYSLMKIANTITVVNG